MTIQIYSHRDSQNRIKLSFFAEDVLTHVCGRRYNHSHAWQLSEKQWKKVINKLVEKLEIAIELNLNTNTIHREAILRKLDHMRNSMNQKANVDAELIFALIALSFEFLGQMPNNQSRKQGIRNAHFKLDQQRSLQYAQSAEQKVQVILQSALSSPYSAHYNYSDLITKYLETKVPNAFIVWFKETYPDLYLKLF